MFAASSHRASSSVVRLCHGSRAAVHAAASARRAAAEPLAVRFVSSGTTAGSSQAAAASSSSATRAAVLALGLAAGSALYFGGLGSSRTMKLEGRPSYGDRLKARSKPQPQNSATNDSAASSSKESSAPAGRPKDEEEAAQGTGAFAASLSETVAAPEAAEVVVEGSDSSSNQSAYNPETGEINWDCPCLGGMANGSCGEQFKAAFSCFVYSEKEPKGIECVEHFRAMQDCFRQHPEEYAEEIADDERAAAEEEAEQTSPADKS